MSIVASDDLIIESFPVGMLMSNCCLIYSNSSKEAIIIDPGNDNKQLRDALQERGLNAIALLHTHAHFDHIGASSVLQNQLHIPMFLHKEDYPLYQNMAAQAQMFNVQIEAINPIDYLFEEGARLAIKTKNLNQFLNDLKIIHTPGHSPGGCCFYSSFFNYPILFAGDTLFFRSIGRADLPGGDYHQLIHSIKTKLLQLPENTIVIPGHGPNTTIEAEKSFNPYLS